MQHSLVIPKTKINQKKKKKNPSDDEWNPGQWRPIPLLVPQTLGLSKGLNSLWPVWTT